MNTYNYENQNQETLKNVLEFNNFDLYSKEDDVEIDEDQKILRKFTQ